MRLAKYCSDSPWVRESTKSFLLDLGVPENRLAADFRTLEAFSFLQDAIRNFVIDCLNFQSKVMVVRVLRVFVEERVSFCFEKVALLLRNVGNR